MHTGSRSRRTGVLFIAALGLVLAGCAAPAIVSVDSPRNAILSAAASSATPPARIDPTALHARVTEAQPQLEAQGIHLVEWGADPRTGRERILVQNLTPAKAATLEGAFGADDIILTSTPYRTAACGCPASARTPGGWPGPPPQPARPTSPGA